MSNLKTRPLVGSIVVISALFAGAVYYLNLPVVPPAVLPETSAVALAEPAKSTTPSAAESVKPADAGTMETVTTPPKIGNEQPVDTQQFSSNPKRDPEEQAILDLAINRKLTDVQKVEQMLSMIPNLPPDAQTLAMENATALIPDESYLAYRGRLLGLARTPDMRTTVMNDSLTRGEEVRLPNLLEMLKTSGDEAEKTEIRYILEAYLDKDYGPQPKDWEAPLAAWVKENTDR